MSKLQLLLGRYAGTRSAAPIARGAKLLYNMQCGGAGNCLTPYGPSNCECHDYDNDDDEDD